MMQVAEAKVVNVLKDDKKEKKKDKKDEGPPFFRVGVRVVFDNGDLPFGTPIALRKPSDVHVENPVRGKYHGLKVFFKTSTVRDEEGNPIGIEITSITVTNPPRLELRATGEPIKALGLPLAIEGRKDNADRQVTQSHTLDSFCKRYKGLAKVALEAYQQAEEEAANKKAA